MSDRLSKQVATDLGGLRQLLDTHRALLSACEAGEPTTDEVPALAAILHSFYSGIERIFKRVAIEVDGAPPRGEFWHADLLESMSHTQPHRPAVISDELNHALQEYMDFRHVFRHAYTYELRWAKMASLVHGIATTLARLEAELTAFLESGQAHTRSGA